MAKENTFLWASVHQPTSQQIESLGKVFMLQDVNPGLLSKLGNIQQDSDLHALAVELIKYARDNDSTLVQPAGSPAFHVVLGKRLAGILATDRPSVIFSYSKRVSYDVVLPEGTKKVSYFKHEGWI